MRIFFHILALSLCICWSSGLSAASYSTLQNLPGVGISVRGLAEEAERFGLTEDDVRRKVERVLQESGIAILAEEAALSAPGSPHLEVTVYLSRLRGNGGHLYTLQTALREVVALERPTEQLVTVPAATWERVSHGIASTPARLLISLERLLARFTDEHREANPRR